MRIATLILLVVLTSLYGCRGFFAPGHDPRGPGNSENAPGHKKRH